MKISFFGVIILELFLVASKITKIIFKDTNTLFIYGANNAGKSTFLKAYMFFMVMKSLTLMISLNVMIKILLNLSWKFSSMS